jgi:hypothetical protein
MARGRDLAAWECKPAGFLVLPTDADGVTLSSARLRVEGPQCHKFIDKFFDALINRKALPYGDKLSPYRKYKQDKRKAEALAGVPPFWVFNARPALSRWKAAWKDVSGAITGKGVLQACVIGNMCDDRLGTPKPIVPEHKVMFIEAKNEDEAHYLAAILNSSVMRTIVAAYTMERQIGTHLTRYVRIPRFDANKNAHQRLVECSRIAHLDAQKRQEVENTIDNLVADKTVFDLEKDEMDQIRDDLQILLE